MPELSRSTLTSIVAGLLLTGAAGGWLLRGPGESSAPFASKIPAVPETQKPASNASSSPNVSSPRAAAAYGKPEWDALPLTQRLEKGFVLKDRFQRFANFASLVATFTTPEDFETAAIAIKAADKRGLQFDHEWEHLLQQWGRQFGLSAIGIVQSKYADPKEPTWSLKKMLGGWAEKDPAAATAWLNEHTETADWDGLLFETLNGISRNSLDTATEAALKSIPAGQSWARDEVMKNLVESAVKDGGLERLHSWFRSLPEDAAARDFRSSAFAAVYKRVEHASEDEGRRFLEESASHDWRLPGAYRSMAAKMAENSPRAALEWLGSLAQPPADLTPAAKWPGANQVVASWQQNDPAAFTAWLQSQPQGPFTEAVNHWSRTNGR